MKIIPLGSSSSGNCYLIDDGKSVLMVECGMPIRKITLLSRLVGYAPSCCAGCLISHEHGDHSRSWREIVDKGVPVYATSGTIDALSTEDSVASRQIHDIGYEIGDNIGDPETIGSYTVVAFRTFHNAMQPAGFLIRSGDDTLVFATDTGNLGYRFPNVTHMMLEANYSDGDLMRNTQASEARKERIRNDHMHIDRLCRYLKSLDLSQCREIWLMHLSDHNSNEYQFRKWVQDVVPNGCKVRVCPKELER